MKRLIGFVVLALVSAAAAAAVAVNPDQVEIPDTDGIVPIAITIVAVLVGFCYYYFRRWDEDDKPPEGK